MKQDHQMDSVEIKKLMSQMLGYMSRYGLQRLKLKTGELELELEKPSFATAAYLDSRAPFSPPSVQQPQAPQITPISPLASSEGHLITAPIVGTFYTSNSPGSAAFVKVGDQVDESTVVCIVEAMKVMNEIRAGKSGTVAEIYVENGHPIEFGTKIMRIV